MGEDDPAGVAGEKSWIVLKWEVEFGKNICSCLRVEFWEIVFFISVKITIYCDLPKSASIITINILLQYATILEKATTFGNLPQSASVNHNLPQFTTIRLDLPQSAKICNNLLQFTAICHEQPQSASINHNLQKSVTIYCNLQPQSTTICHNPICLKLLQSTQICLD